MIMAEIKRNSTPVPNKMTVIDKGDEIARPSSSGSIVRKPLKKATSEGLISLSPEPPNQVQFEEPQRPSSGGSRGGSAGIRIEKKLQVLKKKVEQQTDFGTINSTPNEKIATSQEQTDKSEVLSKPTQKSSSKKTLLEEKPDKKQDSDPGESSETSSDSDSDDSDSDEDKPTAPIEMKGEFIKYVMDEDYEKAKELCQKILLLEPDNSVCIEFHGLIVQKLEQEKQAEEESDDDEEENSDEDEEDDNDDTDSDDDDDSDDDGSDDDSESDSDDDDDYTPPPGLNLIMGGLPIKPQPN